MGQVGFENTQLSLIRTSMGSLGNNIYFTHFLSRKLTWFHACNHSLKKVTEFDRNYSKYPIQYYVSFPELIIKKYFTCSTFTSKKKQKPNETVPEVFWLTELRQ